MSSFSLLLEAEPEEDERRRDEVDDIVQEEQHTDRRLGALLRGLIDANIFVSFALFSALVASLSLYSLLCSSHSTCPSC